MSLKNIKNKFIFSFLIAVITLSAQQKDTTKVKSVPQNPIQELKEQLEETFNDPNFANATWGVMVKSLLNGEVIYKKNADKLFIPASVQKLFTTSAALLLLTDKFHYETSIYLNGEIRNGKIAGDLIIKGMGDPSISSKFIVGGPFKIFDEWIEQLKNKGVTEILGNIVGDNSVFDNSPLGKGWPVDSESFWYSAETGALSINDNCVFVTVEPAGIGELPIVNITPETNYVTVINKAVTAGPYEDENIAISRIHGLNEIVITGRIKKNSRKISEYITVTDPAKYFLTLFKERLELKGIKCDNDVITISECKSKPVEEDLILIGRYASIPLKDIVRETNKNSNNFFAEQLIKTVGFMKMNYGSVEYGLKSATNLFNDMGINPDNMYLVDGSGFSRLNMVTPRHIVNLLSYMYKSEFYDSFYNSLPVAGIDGTLTGRMRRTTAENNVHAKPGYNTGVSSLAGYLKTLDGEPVVFSIIVNNYLVPPALASYIQDMVCIRLSNFSRN